MLLFGGNLSGAAKKLDPAQQQQQKRSTDGLDKNERGKDEHGGEKATLPRTDVLHRLTNHELRLLEELERTRSQLQAEWRHKIADLQLQQQHHGGRDVSSVEQLAQQLSLPSPSSKLEDLKAMMRSKTLVRKPNQSTKSILKHKKSRSNGASSGGTTTNFNPASNNLPLLRSNMDILSVLTTSGETPFEMGLDGSFSPIPQQHVLPIFRLPTVNATATATALAIKEIEVLEEDRDRKHASEALGLSLEEIAVLEAELNGDSSINVTQQRQMLSPELDKKLPGLHHQQPKSKKPSQRGELKWKQGKRAGKETSNEDLQAQRSDNLRKELESALSNVQHLTRLVKDDIVFAQKICPANELRISSNLTHFSTYAEQLYFKRWGRDKVENIFRHLLFNLQGIAFRKWNQVVAHEKQEEKLQAYLMYKGSKKLDHFLLNWSQRKLHQAWTKWWSDIAHVKAIERLALELDAIRVLQRAWRGYHGRIFASLVKAQKLFALQTAAVTKIQRMFRGSVTRKFFRLKQLNKWRQQAATKIQACGRGYLARQLVKQMRSERKRFKTASKIQALYRGRKARREVSVICRNRRVAKAALVIQRRYRGRLGRVKFIRRQIERYRSYAATKIQRIARGRIARRILRDLKLEAAQRRALEHASAIKIQKVYRGHRSRLSTELKLLALREKNRWRAKAATKIQKIMRSCLAKKTVSKLRQEHVAQLVLLARTWVEYWSEDTSSWFYYNQETGEAIWAPPSSGYTKADGNLVLQNGKIIPDPADGDLSGVLRDRKKPSLFDKSDSNAKIGDEAAADHEHEEDDDDDDEDKLCVECEEEDARRRCDQCEDVFCDSCYEKLHRYSKREKHAWKAMGSLRCIECEKMKATRWCYVCQDPYCLGCFTIIHSKGNKVNHDWTDMSTFKKAAKQQQSQLQKQLLVKEEENAQTYDEYMQSHEYQYVTELAVEESAPTNFNTMASTYTTKGAGEWMTLVDESSGQAYYYNSYTGESRWV